MGKSLAQFLFPATVATREGMRNGEFDKEIKGFGDGCAGCRSFARMRIYAYPIISDAIRDGLVLGTAAAVGYRAYQAICN